MQRILTWLSISIFLSVFPWIAVSQIAPPGSNCSAVPCENSGTCDPVSGNCTCTPAFYGARCQLVDYCASGPCSNGGTCELVDDGYRCTCPQEYLAPNCEVANPCFPSPCNNSSTCMIATGTYNFTCVCTEEYTGRFCETPVVAPSSTMQATMTSSAPLSPTPSASPTATSCNPACQNGGTCDETASICNCPLGWGGLSCEMELDIIVPRFEGRGYLTYGPLFMDNTLFRVNFRTAQPNGMILYNAQLHDGSGGDFIQLSIVNGFLDFRFDLGSGISPVQSTVNVDDGEWHEVQISRMDQFGLLTLDGSTTYRSNVSGSHRSLNVAPPLFIGGVSDAVSLAPQALTVQGLTGCVYGFEEDGRTSTGNQYTGGVNVASCEGNICRFSLCSNGALCVLDSGDAKGYTCNCTEGFAGEFCLEATCVTDPCLFGGTCVPNPSTGSYSCVCAFGFTGPNCETTINITLPLFTGSSFLTYNINPSVIYTDTQISLRVKPSAANSSGVLAFASQSSSSGGSGDFFLLAIDRGVVYLQFDCGSGSTPIQAAEPLVPGEWSTIAVSRTAGSAMLYQNSLPPIFGSNPGTFSGLNIANILQLGGVPASVVKPPAVTVWTGFEGCVADFMLGDMDGQSALGGIDGGRNVGECEVGSCFSFTCYNGGTCVAPTSGSPTCQCPSGYLPPNCANAEDNCILANPCPPGASCITSENGQLQCQCPFGQDGPTCLEAINIGIPSFNKSDYAHLVFPTLPSRVAMATTILVSIRPVRSSGLILYSALHSTPESRDFVALIMRDGYLEFRFDLGSGAAVIRSTSPVTLNEWHDVRAQRSSRAGSLSVDGGPQAEGTSPGTSQALNLATPTYVGGAPDYRSLAPSAAVTRGFGGCIDNLVINGMRQTLQEMTSSQDVQNCGEDPCSLLNCLNGGVCVPGATLGEFVCQCVANYTGNRCELEIPDPCILVECFNGGQCVVDEGVARCGCPVPYGGDQCQKTISFSAARFSGFSYMEVHRFSFSSPVLNRDEFSLSFNTNSSSGLLLWVGGDTSAGNDFMALGVNRGRVELRFNLGSGAVMLRPSQFVSDSVWHSVSLVRDGGTAVLSLDGRSSNVTSEFVSLDSSSNFWIGGHPDISSIVFANNLRGCVRDVVINSFIVDLDNPQTLVSSFGVTSCN